MRSEAWWLIEGWFDWQEAYSEAVWRARDGAHFVEIGVFRGRSTMYLAQEIRDSNKAIRFDAWDLFEGQLDIGPGIAVPTAEVVRATLGDLARVVNVQKGRSPDVAAGYADRSLDFVWIDGDHSYEGCAADIRGWWPKVKLGGFMGGHDYSGWFPTVIQAVGDVLRGKARSRPPFSWWYDKTDLEPLG